MLLLCLAGCAHEAPYEDADKATLLFFQRLDVENFNEIYDDASKFYKDSIPREKAIESLKQLKEMGDHTAPTRLSTRFNTYEGHRVVEPVYIVHFNDRKASIPFRFIDEGGEWKLLYFAVNAS